MVVIIEFFYSKKQCKIIKKGKKMEKSFYKNYIEVDKDFEKVMDLIFENNDLLLSYSEEVLFEEGKLLHRKTLLNKNSLINKKVRESRIN